MLDTIINMCLFFLRIIKRNQSFINSRHLESYAKRHAYSDFSLTYMHRKYLFVSIRNKKDNYLRTFEYKSLKSKTKIVFSFSNREKLDYLNIEFYCKDVLIYKPKTTIIVNTNFQGFIKDLEDFKAMHTLHDLIESDDSILSKRADYIKIKSVKKISLINELLNKYLIFDDKIYFELRKDLNFDTSRKKKLLYNFLNCSLYGFSNSCVLSKYESHDEKSFVYKFYIMGGHNNNIFDVYLIIDDELRKSYLYVLKNDNIRSQVADLSTIFIKKSLPYIPSSKRNIFNYKSNLCSEINKILVKYSLPSVYYNLLDSEYYVPLSDEDVKKIMPLTAEHIETLRLLEY